MKKHLCLLSFVAVFLISAIVSASPTIFPTGTTIYNPDKAWNGYTMIAPVEDSRKELEEGGTTLLIDMNGNVVHEWNLNGYPAKILPGGHAMGGMTKPGETLWDGDPRVPTALAFNGFDMVQMDFDGNIVWRFDKYEEVQQNAPGGKKGKMYWSARQHHDWQREGSPTGYYAPGLEPKIKDGKTLILAAKGPMGYMNCTIYEVSWDGKILWEWEAKDHVEEWVEKIGGVNKHNYGKITESGSKKHPTIRVINTASYLGPNRWYDQGDERFHPDNIICDNTIGDAIFIISKKSGEIVWWVGPDYKEDPQLAHLGFQYNQEPFYTGGMLHHAHMIPSGLPGAGNILVFNNGKPYSSVTEFNPVTKQLVWEYSAKQLGHAPNHSLASQSLFSSAESSAQRLPNGNTLINEADFGRVFEVTPELETVWEYVNPTKWYKFRGVWSTSFSRTIYRAYRVPYEWVPQLKKPKERAVIPPANVDNHILPVDE